jgi:GT2 family glycosyltransferase
LLNTNRDQSVTEIVVSVLVHRDFSHIQAALESLYRSTRRQCQVIVVVNLGELAQIEALAAAFPQVEIIVNEQPQSFAANHNQIMRQFPAAYYALLNDDIILQDNALDVLIDYLEAHPDVAVAGPRLQNADGSYQVSVYSDPTLFRMLYKISGLARITRQGSWLRQLVMKTGIVPVQSLQMPQEAQAVDVIKGAVMIVRGAAYQQVGPMDEITLAYGEEIDWHLRFRAAGWQVAIVPQAQVTHYGSGQAELELHGWQLVEDRKAILNYFIKHKPRWQALIIRLAIILAHGLTGLFWWLVRSQRAQAHFETARVGLAWHRGLS